jgi:cyclopropane fatty-acyl-phospholipid synthase-like methyltransferase
MSEWDTYWIKESKIENKIYDYIAVRYRKYIIKPYLKKYIYSHFQKGSILLHAGCGGGLVEDDNINNDFTVIGIDMSQNALNLYKSTHINYNLIRGDVTTTGLKTESIDGIYSLGLMEHFTTEEIRLMLIEFNRIIKSNGTIIICAPPEYGSTVTFFKFVDYILTKILKSNIWFQPHPKSEPEINQIKSKQWMEDIVKNTGLVITEFNFEFKDLYTHVAVVLKKIK